MDQDETLKLGEFLRAAAAANIPEAVKLFVERGGDVNTPDPSFGTTALIIAARRGHREFVEALLAAGANASASALGGTTALSAAKKAGRVEIVRLLETTNLA